SSADEYLPVVEHDLDLTAGRWRSRKFLPTLMLRVAAEILDEENGLEILDLDLLRLAAWSLTNSHHLEEGLSRRAIARRAFDDMTVDKSGNYLVVHDRVSSLRHLNGVRS